MRQTCENANNLLQLYCGPESLECSCTRWVRARIALSAFGRLFAQLCLVEVLHWRPFLGKSLESWSADVHCIIANFLLT